MNINTHVRKSGEDIMIILDCTPAIAEPISQPKLVPRSQFSEHVKAMHRERDRGFKSEFLVCFSWNGNTNQSKLAAMSFHLIVNVINLSFVDVSKDS